MKPMILLDIKAHTGLSRGESDKLPWHQKEALMFTIQHRHHAQNQKTMTRQSPLRSEVQQDSHKEILQTPKITKHPTMSTNNSDYCFSFMITIHILIFLTQKLQNAQFLNCPT